MNSLSSVSASENVDRRVLIVDDDRDFAESLGEALELEGYRVATASSSEEAVEAANRFGPDVMLLDLKLGRDNGLDLVPIVRERSPFVGCMVVTGHADVDSAIRAVRFRIEDYLRKPVKHDELLRALGRCFDLRRAEWAKRTPLAAPLPERTTDDARDQKDAVVPGTLADSDLETITLALQFSDLNAGLRKFVDFVNNIDPRSDEAPFGTIRFCKWFEAMFWPIRAMLGDNAWRVEFDAYFGAGTAAALDHVFDQFDELQRSLEAPPAAN